MVQRAADSKAGLIDALVRRGHSRTEALSLADQLSATPAEHKAAREQIGEALEFRAA
ncbi:hypothetical protein ABT150_01970 [Streptomyces mirabilis]|uniref:hypothetical protein n=1 Tax=Streptomyces mirabilis TaxID=68239 RepID=UPI0033327D76